AADVTLHQAGSVPKNEFLTDLEKLDKLHSGEPEDVESQGSQGSADAMEIDDGERNSREPVDMTKKIYNLDYQINVWSDYLRLHLHPKTVSLVQEYEHQSESENFNAFTYGSQVMNSTKSSDDIEDRIRFFTEESDQLQGFQFSVDTFDGFSGLGCKLVEQLSDEFSSKSIITFATSPAHFPNSTTIEDSQRVINSVLSYDGLCNHSSLCLPLCVSSTLWRQPGLATNFPNLIYDANLNYHSSAILAMALETATLPYRLENNCIQMSTITDALSTMGRKLSSLSVSLPVPLSTDSSLAEMFKHYTDLSPWQPITPYCSQASPQNCFAQTVSLRGIPKQLLKSPPIEGKHVVIWMKC
uniref:Protein misato homolog 1-like n=1 Tax=Saccoglossus kowalevskii TaxID=10224 RepID=A0ABM0MAX4_SACKO